MLASERAATESVGTILLVAVVVVSVSVASGAVFSYRIASDGPPAVDLAATVTDGNVTVHHRGGDALALADVTVVVRADGRERRFVPDAANVTVGDADDRFEAAERWSRAHGAAVVTGDRVRVVVVHEPTDAVVLDATRRVERPADPALARSSTPDEAPIDRPL